MPLPNVASLAIISAVLIGLQTYLNSGELIDQWWLPLVIAVVGAVLKSIQELMSARPAQTEKAPPGAAGIAAYPVERKSVIRSVLVG
jgi:hypothetical protein